MAYDLGRPGWLVSVHGTHRAGHTCVGNLWVVTGVVGGVFRLGTKQCTQVLLSLLTADGLSEVGLEEVEVSSPLALSAWLSESLLCVLPVLMTRPGLHPGCLHLRECELAGGGKGMARASVLTPILIF